MRLTTDKAKLTNVESELRALLARCAQLRKERDTLRTYIKVKSPAKHDPTTRANEIQTMREEGMSYAEIGRRLGITGQRVAQILRQARYRERMKEWDPNGTAISGRTRRCLNYAYDVELDLQSPDPDVIFRAEREITKLLRTPNFGRKSAQEIKGIAESYRRMGLQPKEIAEVN